MKKSRDKLPENSPYAHRLQKVQCRNLLGPKTGEGRAASFPGMNHQQHTLRQLSSLHLSFPTTHFTCTHTRALTRRCSVLVASPLPPSSALTSGRRGTGTFGQRPADSPRAHATGASGHAQPSQCSESSVPPQKQPGSRGPRSESSHKANKIGRDFWEECNSERLPLTEAALNEYHFQLSE